MNALRGKMWGGLRATKDIETWMPVKLFSRYAPIPHIFPRHTSPSYSPVIRRSSWCNMLPSCNPCYRHASTAVPRRTDVRGLGHVTGQRGRRTFVVFIMGRGPGGRGPGGAGEPDDGAGRYRRGVSTRGGGGADQRGRGRPPAASGPLDSDLLRRVTLLFSGGGIEIDTGRTREISIERGCYGTRHRTLSGSAAGRPRTPPARGGSRSLSFMSWPVRRGPRAFRSGRSFGPRSIETGSPIGGLLILKEW